jgi:putative endonuclease
MQTKAWWMYVVKCSDGTFYCGATTDVTQRILTHNAKKGAKYTKTRTPVQLVYQERCIDHSEALIREHAFKKLTRTEKEKFLQHSVL